MTIGKNIHQKPINYNVNVLIGPFVEERRHYVKNCLKHVTSYSVDYTPKPYTYRKDKHLFNNKFQGEGLHPRIIRDHEKSKYLENYSSLYDLSYNHFPKCLKKPLLKTFSIEKQIFQPEIDYTLNYGNLTDYNILPQKRVQWCRDKHRGSNNSHYTDVYLPPNDEDYNFRRFANPRPNSSKLLKANVELRHLQLRGQTYSLGPEPVDMVVVQRSPRCDPITWKCPDVTRDPTRCIENLNDLDYNTTIPYSCIKNKNKANL